MNTFIDTALQAAGLVIGGVGPMVLGFFVVRFLLALISVWEESAKYARLVAEEVAKAPPYRVASIHRCPNPRYMSIVMHNLKGTEIVVSTELPVDMHWERR